MKRLGALFILVLLAAGPVFAEHSRIVPGRAIVKFKKHVVSQPRGVRTAAVEKLEIRAASVKALSQKFKVKKMNQMFAEALANRPDWKYLEDYYEVSFEEKEKSKEMVQAFSADVNVEQAFPDYVVTAQEFTPNDPLFSSQYALAKINAPQAWDRTTGESSVVVAVLDTGVKTNHSDLAANLDLVRARNFAGEESFGDTNVTDTVGHGTKVSGLIGGVVNNGVGIAGVAGHTKILPIKVLSAIVGNLGDVWQGVVYANSLSVEVINMSVGGYDNMTSLETDCQNAYNNGVTIVAAAGNNDTSSPIYPGSYDSVLSVAAVDENDVKANFSNHGDWVDVSAPGVNVLSTAIDGSYDTDDGTSFSSPIVAGLAALLKAAKPDQTPAQIFYTITHSADNIDSSNEAKHAGKLGSGRINAYRAVSGVLATINSPAAGAYVTGAVNITGEAAGWDFHHYLLEAVRVANGQVTTLEANVTTSKEGTIYTWPTGTLEGAYTLRLGVWGNAGYTQEAVRSIVLDNVTPEANISVPTSDATVTGRVQIIGTAADSYLDKYILAFGVGATPESYELIARSADSPYYYQSVTNGLLGTWETSGLNGVYTIKLTVIDRAAHTVTKTTTVNLVNTQPVTKEADPFSVGLGNTFALPNPFDKSATTEVQLVYRLEGNFATSIYLFDLSGGLIWQKSYSAGENGGKSGINNPPWQGINLFNQNVDNGVYVYQVTADRRVIARGKVIVLN